MNKAKEEIKMFDSKYLEALAKAAKAEAEQAEYDKDEAAKASYAADEAEDWEACDKAEAEYKHLKYAAIDLQNLAETLAKAAEALDYIEAEAPEYLTKLGLI